MSCEGGVNAQESNYKVFSCTQFPQAEHATKSTEMSVEPFLSPLQETQTYISACDKLRATASNQNAFAQ